MDPSTSTTRQDLPAALAWAAAALLALVVACVLQDDATAPLSGNAETRCHEVVREMLSTGDVLVPRLEGEPRLQKPPLLYWLACLCTRACGGSDLLGLRLPSALAALGLLVVLVRWGREAFDADTGFLAAGLLASTYLFQREARQGSYEMVLAFFCTASLYAAWRSSSRPGGGGALLAGCLFGLAFLTKGTPALLFVPLPLLLWSAWSGRLRGVFDRRVLASCAVAAVLALAWYVYVFATVPGALQMVLGQALLPVGARPFGDVSAEHPRPVWWYLVEGWRYLSAPAIFLPLVVLGAVRQRLHARDSLPRLLLLAVAAPFLVLCLIPMKQPHYLIPLFPVLALWMSSTILCEVRQGRGRVATWLVAGVGLLSVLCGAGEGWELVVVADWRIGVGAGLVLAFVAAGIATWVALRRRAFRIASVACVAASIGLWSLYIAVLRPTVDAFDTGRAYCDPRFDRGAWEAKFTRYPFLRTLLHAGKRDPKTHGAK